jgi:hypothetical protein
MEDGEYSLGRSHRPTHEKSGSYSRPVPHSLKPPHRRAKERAHAVDPDWRGHSEVEDAEGQAHPLVFTLDLNTKVQAGFLLRVHDDQIATARQDDGGERSRPFSYEQRSGFVCHDSTSVFVMAQRAPFCGFSVGPAVPAVLPERPGQHSRPYQYPQNQR